jgi:hypothetical protein
MEPLKYSPFRDVEGSPHLQLCIPCITE